MGGLEGGRGKGREQTKWKDQEQKQKMEGKEWREVYIAENEERKECERKR